MSDFTPHDPRQHFAQQRTKRAAETAVAASNAQRKSNEETRSTNERFYNSLALYSGGTIALSVTFMGYLKTLARPLAHSHWLRTCWMSLLLCAACSLFWPFVYGYYSHYFHEWQTADASKDQLEIEAREYPTMVRGVRSVQTDAFISNKEIEEFQSNRLRAAAIYEKRAATAKRRETLYLHLSRWLGRVAQLSFLIGLGFLLAFAIKNL